MNKSRCFEQNTLILSLQHRSHLPSTANQPHIARIGCRLYKVSCIFQNSTSPKFPRELYMDGNQTWGIMNSWVPSIPIRSKFEVRGPQSLFFWCSVAKLQLNWRKSCTSLGPTVSFNGCCRYSLHGTKKYSKVHLQPIGDKLMDHYQYLGSPGLAFLTAFTNSPIFMLFLRVVGLNPLWPGIFLSSKYLKRWLSDSYTEKSPLPRLAPR